MSGNNLTNSEDIAEGFNEFFSNIGPDLGSKIDTSNYNFQDYINTQHLSQLLPAKFTIYVAFLVQKPLALTKFQVKFIN